MSCRHIALLLVALAFAPPVLGEAPQVKLAESGRPLLPVVVAEKASAETKASAAKLADYLGRISGAKFSVEIGDGSRGLAVGTAADFPAIKHGIEFKPGEITRREEYLLRTHAQGVWLIGATDLAARHAVWDVLHRLGYRQFFPGPAWEVIPDSPALSITVDTVETPSYHSRRIWYGFGAWDYAKEPYRDWNEKNRSHGGVELSTGHAYDGIVKALAKEFEAHPDWWPQINGERKPVKNTKPCLGNPDVRAAMIRTVLARPEKGPARDSVSIDPSDGGGWCECEKCRKLGTVSDQAITLANELAEAAQKKQPGMIVGLYAYNYHSAPPTIKVHPKVVVSAATAFIKGGQSLDEILTGWAAMGATLGIREYYSVNTWDRDQPAHARGGNLDYLQRTIPEFHAKGSRYMSAESSDNWGPNGLGYYFANRVLWNVSEAKRKDEIVADFLEKAFGPAREPMAEFYRQLDGSHPHLVTDDQLGRMYRAIEKARTLANTPAIHRRLDDLALYARYATLFQRYTTSDAKTRQASYEALIRHAYRMRTTMLVHTYALYRDLSGRDKSLVVPAEAKWQVPEGKNPWKNSEPFKAEEIAGFLKEGIASHKLVELEFKPVAFGTDLVPAAAKLGFPKDKPAGELGAGRGVQTFHTFVEKETTLELVLTGGLIAHYRDRGNVKVELWKIGGASQTGEKETLVASDKSTPPDGKEYAVKLAIKEPGHYRVTVSDGSDRTMVKWPDALPMNWVSDQAKPMNGTYGQWMGYFYVPKGTKTVGFFGGEHGEIRDAEDRPQFWLNGKQPNFYSVAVPEGQDGKVWKVRYVRGPLRLLTVPPVFARTPGELLVPKEIVEREGKQ